MNHQLFQTAKVGKVAVTSLTWDELLGDISGSSAASRYYCFSNAKSIVDADNNVTYLNVLNSSWINSPDGKPVAAAISRMLRKHQARLAGPDVFEHFMNRTGVERHFLLGATIQVLDTIEHKASANIVGKISPEYRDPNESDITSWVEAIVASGATHLWLGLGSPKQDFVAAAISKELHKVKVLGVGAAFDFYANTLRRAPKFMQTLGLEWLHRLMKEPSRLLNRYLIGNLKFLFILLRQSLR